MPKLFKEKTLQNLSTATNVEALRKLLKLFNNILKNEREELKELPEKIKGTLGTIEIITKRIEEIE